MLPDRAIPRCLHFIWLGDESIPPGRQECIDSCTRLHPDYEVHIWRSEKEFGKLYNQRVFDAAENIAPPAPRGNPHQIRTNILRFEIMLRHGGVFLDSDVYALRSVDPLISEIEREHKEGGLGWEIQDRWMGEAVIMARLQARFMEDVVERLGTWAMSFRGRPATVTVGPQFITPVLKSKPLDILLFPQPYFYPARHDQPDLGDAIIAGEHDSPDTYLVHRFGNFRRKQGVPL